MARLGFEPLDLKSIAFVVGEAHPGDDAVLRHSVRAQRRAATRHRRRRRAYAILFDEHFVLDRWQHNGARVVVRRAAAHRDKAHLRLGMQPSFANEVVKVRLVVGDQILQPRVTSARARESLLLSTTLTSGPLKSELRKNETIR